MTRASFTVWETDWNKLRQAARYCSKQLATDMLSRWILQRIERACFCNDVQFVFNAAILLPTWTKEFMEYIGLDNPLANDIVIVFSDDICGDWMGIELQEAKMTKEVRKLAMERLNYLLDHVGDVIELTNGNKYRVTEEGTLLANTNNGCLFASTGKLRGLGSCDIVVKEFLVSELEVGNFYHRHGINGVFDSVYYVDSKTGELHYDYERYSSRSNLSYNKSLTTKFTLVGGY